MTKPINISNERYGRLVAINPTSRRSGQNIMWECKCDCGEMTLVNANSLRRGLSKSCGCLRVAENSRRTAENHPNYKAAKTDEERLLGRYGLYGENCSKWSKSVMERDNYTCRICGNYKDKHNAHHLNSWDTYPDQRFDVDNGVTLCVTCHISFHKTYGYGNNTEEQFEEFKIKNKQTATV